MNKKLIRECLRIAEDFHPRHPLRDTFSHYSFIFQNNSMLGWGINVNAIPPIHFGYGKRIQNFPFLPKIHAELNCYNKVKGILNPRYNWICVNIRLNKLNEMKISQPCSVCATWMKALGCSKVYFSTDIGFAKITLDS